MRRNGEITFPWATGDHRFRLGIGELEILQEETGFGPYLLADRLRTRMRAVKLVDEPLLGIDGDEPIIVSLSGEINPPLMLPPECTAKEIATVLRLGLIGGGLKHGEASKLIRSYVEDKPVEHNRMYAFAVLQSALYGAPEEDVGEPVAPSQDEESQQQPSQTED